MLLSLVVEAERHDVSAERRWRLAVSGEVFSGFARWSESLLLAIGFVFLEVDDGFARWTASLLLTCAALWSRLMMRCWYEMSSKDCGSRRG